MSNAESVKNTQKQKRALVRRYKAFRGCATCGERDPSALDIHHLVADEKNTKLSKVLGTGRYITGGGAWQNLSFVEIVAELKQCQVLCSNSHRKLTSVERGWGALDSLPASKDALRAEIELGIIGQMVLGDRENVTG